MAKMPNLFCLLVMAAGALGIAQTKDNTDAPTHDGYVKLNREIFARHDDPDSEKIHVFQADKVSQIRSQLRNLTTQTITAVLGNASSSTQVVTQAISGLQGEMSFLSGWGPQATNTPFADFFRLNGTQVVAVAYVILQGGDAVPDTQPYLEFWDQASGSWAIKAEAPTRSDFRGHTFCVSHIDSGIPGEEWFLAWGMTLGNPGTPLDARLYSFDGYAVRTVWKRENLTKGRLTVSKGSVVLEYDHEYQSADPYNRVREVLHVTPNGLE